MSNPEKPIATTPVPATKGKPAKAAKPAAKPAPAKEAEAPRKPARVANPVMVHGSRVWRNISLMFASALLWTSWRFLYIRLALGDELHFRPYDILFVVLPAGAAYFLNLYWLREQRTDVMTKWSISWGAINLIFFAVAAFLASHPLHMWLKDLSTAAAAT